MFPKKFHIGDILSITTEHLVSPRHMDGVYDILNFMTGDDLFTFQLPRAGDICRPYLLEQHPQLKDIDASMANEENWKSWIEEQIAKYGEFLVVEPLPEGVYQHKDPIEEAKEIRDKLNGMELG